MDQRLGLETRLQPDLSGSSVLALLSDSFKGWKRVSQSLPWAGVHLFPVKVFRRARKCSYPATDHPDCGCGHLLSVLTGLGHLTVSTPWGRGGDGLCLGGDGGAVQPAAVRSRNAEVRRGSSSSLHSRPSPASAPQVHRRWGHRHVEQGTCFRAACGENVLAGSLRISGGGYLGQLEGVEAAKSLPSLFPDGSKRALLWGIVSE